MENYAFKETSEVVSFAAYNASQRLLYLTFVSGKTTIVYQNVAPGLWEELKGSTYPDVCVRFKVQAKHSFRRVDPLVEALGSNFLK